METPPQAQVPPAPAPSKQRIFVTRLTSTLILWAVISLAIHWRSQPLFVGIACFFGLAGTMEYSSLLVRDAQHRAYALLGICIGIGYWTFVVTHVLLSHTEPPLWLDLVALTVAVQGSFLLCYREELDSANTLRRIFSTVFGVLYTVVFYGFIVRLMYFHSNGSGITGVFLMLYLIMVTKFSDMGAYALGSLIGKHKMIPHISPAKSWEGLCGAVLASTAASVLLMFLVPQHLAPLTWMHSFILVPILVFTAVTGDLAESIIKRCIAIKDTGHKFPGIGGILDLTDSLLFTAPVFYFYLSALAS